MKRERTSYAFLMEMTWVCAFFLICASIFVMAFAKAEQVSHQADVLNRAVQATSNTIEEIFAEINPDAPDGLGISDLLSTQSYLDQYSTEDFEITVEHHLDHGLLTLIVTAVNPNDGTVIYTLTGARAIEEGGAS